MKAKKTKRKELDIDFIQSKSLSQQDEKELSDLIRKLKEKTKKPTKKAA